MKKIYSGWRRHGRTVRAPARVRRRKRRNGAKRLLFLQLFLWTSKEKVGAVGKLKMNGSRGK